jgi:hypothetical protein
MTATRYNIADIAFDAIEDLSTSQLVAVHNALNADKQVKKFQDRATALRRVLPLLPAVAEGEAVEQAPEVQDLPLPTPSEFRSEPFTQEEAQAHLATHTQEEQPQDEAPLVQEAKPQDATPSAQGRKGKPSRSAGKGLYPTQSTVEKGNPRRENTHGRKSLQIIIDNPGISYEDFLTKGGRNKDLLWDIKYGHAEVK